MATLRTPHSENRTRPPAEDAKPVGGKFYGVALAVIGLLAALGTAVTSDCQAIKAMLEVWRHLQHNGF